MAKFFLDILVNMFISALLAWMFYDFGASRVADKGLLETLTYGFFVLVMTIYTVSDRITNKLEK